MLSFLHNSKYSFNFQIQDFLSSAAKLICYIFQVYELYNGGARPVNYEFDLTPLELIKQENFDQPIFECLNPRGEIPPGRTLNVEWRFSPVEAKTYMVSWYF